MKMKSLLHLMSAAAMVSYLSGCASPQLAQTPLDSEEEEWKASIKGSYKSWTPPQTEPELETGAGTATVTEPFVDVVIEENIVATQPPAAPLGGSQTYTVQANDSLWKIADKFYGDGKKWRLIADANTAVLPNPSKLKPGMVLTIPAAAAEPAGNPPLK